MGDINHITASTQEKTRNDTEQFPEILRNVPQKCRSWSCTSFNSANIKYTLHTLLIAQIQIQRECPLFIRVFSNWAFQPHWRSDKTNNLMPNGMHNSGSRIRWRINLKGKNEVKSGTNEEQYP